MDSNVEFWKLILNVLKKVYSDQSFIRASIDDDGRYDCYDCYCDFLESKNIKNKIVVFDHKIVFFVDKDLCFSMKYYMGLVYPNIEIFLHKGSSYDYIKSELFFIPFRIVWVMDKLFKVKPDKDYSRKIDVKNDIVDIINKLTEENNDLHKK